MAGIRAALSDPHAPGPADLAEASRAAGIRDERLLAAIDLLPRAVFVPGEFATSSYLDEPVRITHQQVTTQPSLVAKMVEALALRGKEKVLEVGTGYGYQTALLAMLAREGWSVDQRGRFTALRDAALEVAHHQIQRTRQLAQLRSPQLLGSLTVKRPGDHPAQHHVAEQTRSRRYPTETRLAQGASHRLDPATAGRRIDERLRSWSDRRRPARRRKSGARGHVTANYGRGAA
jgi:hypothetical protein